MNRSGVAAEVVGDHEAARRVELELLETGVCSLDWVEAEESLLRDEAGRRARGRKQLLHRSRAIKRRGLLWVINSQG